MLDVQKKVGDYEKSDWKKEPHGQAKASLKKWTVGNQDASFDGQVLMSAWSFNPCMYVLGGRIRACVEMV